MRRFSRFIGLFLYESWKLEVKTIWLNRILPNWAIELIETLTTLVQTQLFIDNFKHSSRCPK